MCVCTYAHDILAHAHAHELNTYTYTYSHVHQRVGFIQISLSLVLNPNESLFSAYSRSAPEILTPHFKSSKFGSKFIKGNISRITHAVTQPSCWLAELYDIFHWQSYLKSVLFLLFFSYWILCAPLFIYPLLVFSLCFYLSVTTWTRVRVDLNTLSCVTTGLKHGKQNTHLDNHGKVTEIRRAYILYNTHFVITPQVRRMHAIIHSFIHTNLHMYIPAHIRVY